MILLKLLLAHLIGDFFLQPRKWIEDKEKQIWKSGYLYVHIVVHFVLVLVVLWDMTCWTVALVIAGSHFLIDGMKLRFQTGRTKTFWFWADQLSHVAVLIAIWFIFWEGYAPEPMSDRFWIILTGLLILTFPSSIAMQQLMNGWNEQIETETADSLEGAGQFIGILERLFVYISIVSGNPQIIGFLLAAKSVFRFGDLTRSKDRKLTEYILIGTLTSFLIAIITGLITIRFLS